MSQDDRAIALLDAVIQQGGRLTPEQEREWDGLSEDTEALAGTLFLYIVIQGWIEARYKALAEKRKQADASVDFLRAKMLHRMEALASKRQQDADQNCTVTYIPKESTQGRVEIAPGFTIDDVPLEFVEIEIVKKLRSDKVREAIDAGGQVAGCRIVREPTVRVTKTARGKLADIAFELNPRGVLGNGGSGPAD